MVAWDVAPEQEVGVLLSWLQGREKIINTVIGDGHDLLAQEGEEGRGQVSDDWLGIGGGWGIYLLTNLDLEFVF